MPDTPNETEPKEAWFTTSNPEWGGEFDGPYDTREAAIEAGRAEYGSEGFCIGTGVAIDYASYLPSGWQVVSDVSEDASDDVWVPVGGLAKYWGVGEAHFRDLEARMATAFRDWAWHHSLDACYSVTATEGIPALTEGADS